MKVSEFLHEVRDELAAHFIKGTLRNGNGDVCSRGAVRRVAARHLDQLDVAAKADAALLAVCQEVHGLSIEGVNDGYGQQNMLDLTDKTICGLEEIGQ